MLSHVKKEWYAKLSFIIDKINSGGVQIIKEDKNRAVKLASEVVGMQKQREFIPYVQCCFEIMQSELQME